VTGSRTWTDYDTLMRGMVVAIETLISRFPDDKTITLVTGRCPSGADKMAENFMERARKFLLTKGITVIVEPHPANWAEYGNRAGPIRNKEMVDLGADLCVAFFHGVAKGTTGCTDMAKRAGIEVLEYRS